MRKTVSVILFFALCCLHYCINAAEKVNFLFEIAGKKGENPKEFDNIQSIGTDSKGNIYIVDSDNNRVQVFDKEGAYVYQFGRKGSNNGEFNTPFGIAVNSYDEIYVTEQGNSRVQVFDSTGKFLFAFGQKGNQKGRFNTPGGIAVDLYGFVYVADSRNDRIQVFTRQGIFIKSFGSSGDLHTQFDYPSYVAVDNERNIFVVDKNNNRIQKFDSRGYFLLNVGNKDNKKYKQLFSASVSEYGTLYAADIENYCVHVISNLGEFQYSFGSKGTGRGQFLELSGIYMDKNNRLYIADRKNNRVEIYEIEPDEKAQKKPSAPRPVDILFVREMLCNASDIGADINGNIYMSNPANNNIQVFNPDGTLKFVFGGEGEDKGKFKNPSGLAVSPGGNIAVSDSKNYRIQIFDSTGKYLFGFGRKGEEKGEFLSPSGLVYDEKGEKLYAVDKKNNRVQVFNKDGIFLTAFGASENKANQLNYPEDVAIAPDGAVYVADTGNNRVQKYNISFENEISFGKSGKGEGEFDKPVCVSTDKDRKIYVLDKGNNRIQIFDSSLKFIMEFGSEGKGIGQFNDLQGLAVQNLDAQNYIYAADAENKRMQVFTLCETPRSPAGLASYGDEKGIKLTWEKNPESFVYEYYIYKSDDLAGDYTFVDKTRANEFFIPASPDSSFAQSPYYKISAAAPRGFVSPQSAPVTDYFVLGYNFFKQGKFPESAVNFQKETELHLDNYNAHYLLGIVYFRQDKWQEAEKKFNNIVRLQPQNGYAHYYLGAALSRQKSYDKAVFELKEALKIEKNSFMIYSELGEAFLNKELYNEAIEALKNALQMGETNPKLHYHLGLSYYKQRKYDQAVDELKQCIKDSPKEFYARYYLGKTYTALGENDMAVQSFKEASEIDPQNLEVFFLTGLIYVSQKKYMDAVAEFKVAASLDAKNPVYKYNLGLAYFYGGDMESAVHEFSEAAKLEPGNPDYHYYTGLALSGIDIDRALSAFNTVVNLNPNYLEVYLQLGILYEKKNRIPEAIESYRKALEKNSGDIISVNYALGKLYSEVKNYELAEKYFSDVIRVDVNNIDALLQLGNVEDLQEKSGDAIQTFQKIISIEPKNIKARLQLASIYTKNKMKKEAVGEYRTILDIDPGNPDSFYFMGLFYMQSGLFDHAREHFTKAGEYGGTNILYKNALDNLEIFIKKEQERIVMHITPSDPPISDFTKRILDVYHAENGYNIPDDLRKIFVIFDGISAYGTICTARSPEINFNEPKELQYPRETLKNKIGNDVDCAIFLSACLEKEGIAVNFIKNPSFVVLLVNTGASIEEAEKISGDSESYAEKDNLIWIPVDVSMFGSSFLDSWKQGIKKYKEYLAAKEKSEIFNIKEYRVKVPEDKLPESDFAAETPKESDLNLRLQEDLKNFYKERISSLIKKYNEKLKITPDDLKLRLALAGAYDENSQKEGAAGEYGQVLLMDEKNLTALYFLADYSLSREKRDEALNYFLKILNFYPQEPRAMFEIAEIYYSQDKSKEALELYQKYLKMGTQDKKRNSQAQLKIGLCYASLKEMKKAIEELEKFIKEYPEHELIEDTKKTLGLLKSGYSEE
ncbi:MAG: tetratricopeptide repeat protein [bacterium]